MPAPSFSPGFRFSALDGALLIVGGAAAGIVGWFVPWLGFGIGFVLLHFFLFCNVFRVGRMLELIWAGWFLTLASITVLTAWPDWIMVAILSGVATAVVIGIEMSKPSYHGVAWRRINPGLAEWWTENVTARHLPPMGRFVRRLEQAELIGHCIKEIRQVSRTDQNGLDWAVTFYVLDSGLCFPLPNADAGGLAVEEPPAEAEVFYNSAMQVILGKPIVDVLKDEDECAHERLFLLLEDSTLVTDEMAAPHGTGSAGVYIYPPGEFDRAPLVPFWPADNGALLDPSKVRRKGATGR